MKNRFLVELKKILTVGPMEFIQTLFEKPTPSLSSGHINKKRLEKTFHWKGGWRHTVKRSSSLAAETLVFLSRQRLRRLDLHSFTRLSSVFPCSPVLSPSLVSFDSSALGFQYISYPESRLAAGPGHTCCSGGTLTRILLAVTVRLPLETP